MEKIMADIFSFIDYREFLKTAFQQRQAKNPAFSYRYISQKAGIKSSGFLSWVLKGKRNITSHIAADLAKILLLSKKETSYLLLLVQYNQSRRQQDKQRLFEELLRYKRGPVKTLTEQQYEFYSQWYIAVVRELIAIYRITDENFASLLQPAIKPSEAKKALEILCGLGLVRKGKAGAYERVDASIESGNALRVVAVRKFQMEMMDIAKAAIERFEPAERDVSTITMSIDDETLDKIKCRLDEVRSEIVEMARAVPKPNRVYQLNVQLFPVCKKLRGQP
jgi:uncharacterized protein (TIGR02147 family)